MKRYLFLLVLLLSLISFSNVTVADSQWDREDIPIDKIWSITFNEDVDETSIKNSIFIEDSDGKRLSNIEVKLNNTSLKSVTVENVDKYKYGETYKLYISNQIKSKNGKSLKNEVHMTFSTIKGTNSSSPPYLDIIGLKNGITTDDNTHQLSVKTDEGALVTVTLNGEKVNENNGVYVINFSKEGGNIIHVSSLLNGVITEKQIEVSYISSELSTSEITRLNDEKVVLIEVNSRDGISQGSGVIVGNGLVLTNEHVVEGMREGIVTLSDGTEYVIDGIVASDEIKDLALIKTTKEIVDVEPVSIGTFSSLEKGDKIVAIGSPLGLQNTVSEGIVSSFRLIEGVQYIQISVPIDHGSSGGGLFNKKGELVGITTSGYTSNADLNFAVAIDEASNWYRYFSMIFKDIAVLPPEVITNPPVFGEITLGMTKNEVKNLETGTLLNEESDSLFYDDIWIFNYHSEVIYEFENNKLVSINIYHTVVDNLYDLDLLEIYFNSMLDNLGYIYGEPYFLDTNWLDDSDNYNYTLSAYWKSNGHDILLVTEITVEYLTYGGIRISINE